MAEAIKGYTLTKNEKGTVNISIDVLATIAALAASDTEGVLSIGENVKYAQVAKGGIKANSKGLRIEVSEQKVSVEIAVKLKFGTSIPKIVEAVQDKVSSAITNMTGLEVSVVNVSIIGISEEEE